MAATLYLKNADGSQGDQQKSGQVQESVTLEGVAVLADASTENELTVRTALAGSGYVYGAAHPVMGTGYRLRSRTIKRRSPLVFDITLTYRTPEFDPDAPAETPPWLARTKVNFGSVTEEKPIEFDIYGEALKTAANEPIQGLTRPFSNMVIKLSRAFESFSASSFYTYSDVVNSDTFLGFEPGLLLARAPNATENEWNGFLYYDVTQDIEVRKPLNSTVTSAQAWHKRVLHKGTRFRAAVGAFPFTGVATKPVLLADDGTLLGDGLTAKFLSFEVFESVAFSGMGWF